MRLYIKNMVCPRCITAVRNELEQMKIDTVSIELGEVEIVNELTAEETQQLDNSLKKLGLSCR